MPGSDLTHLSTAYSMYTTHVAACTDDMYSHRKGSGAGAQEGAVSVLSDILNVSRRFNQSFTLGPALD